MSIATNHVSNIASHLSGIGTEQARIDLTSPRSILEHIINFFTGNALSERRTRQYDAFAQAMSDAIHLACLSKNSLQIPETLIVDFSGCTVTFTRPGENHHASSKVIIEVMKNGKKIESEVDHEKFCTISTALLLRYRGGLSPISISLTDEGDMDLRGANLLKHDLSGTNLEKADLSGANLCGANLSKANLNGANLRSANLNGANLSDASLKMADLSTADLKKVVLARANLCEANLCGASLTNADLSDANLNMADLRKAKLLCANLNGANLHTTDLNGVDLRWAKLSGANLHMADLNGADLRWANLSGANLEGARLNLTHLGNNDLTGANLARAYLRITGLEKADLRGADLSNADLGLAYLNFAKLNEANLSYADLSGAELKRADLRGTDLSATKLKLADLSGADLSQAKLSRVDLTGANLSGANLSNLLLDGTLLELPERWTLENADTYLNHINNRESGSLLTMIDSIDTQYTDIKLRLARELMASLQGVSTEICGSVALPLLDVLSKKPYTDHADTTAWLDNICSIYLSQYHTQILPSMGKAVFNYSANLFTHQPSLMFSLNGTFIQLLHQAMSQHDAADKARAAELYDSYLNNDKAQRYTHLDDFGAYGTHRVDWQDEHAANYLLFSSHSDGPVMLCSQNTLHGLLQPDPSHPVWDRFYLHDNQAVALHPTAIPLETLFKAHFPLFLKPYQYEKYKACFGLLLDALDLGDMHTLFVSATSAITSTTKLVDPEHQLKLAEIFNPKLQHHTDPTNKLITDKLITDKLITDKFILEPVHYNNIIQAYGLTSSTDVIKAQTLLSLAAVFTRYSSSAIFGQESESPEMLRRYAYALMEKAHTLDATIFNYAESKSTESRDMFPEWSKKLLGIDNAFSCTAILSSLMVSHIKATFPDILATIMPPAWS